MYILYPTTINVMKVMLNNINLKPLSTCIYPNINTFVILKKKGDIVAVAIYWMCLPLHVQLVPIATKAVNSIPDCGEVYPI